MFDPECTGKIVPNELLMAFSMSMKGTGEVNPIWPNKRGPLGIFRVHEGHRYGGFNTIWRSKLLVAFSMSQERHRKARFKPYKHKHFSGLLRGKNKAFSPTVCGTTKELLVSFNVQKVRGKTVLTLIGTTKLLALSWFI